MDSSDKIRQLAEEANNPPKPFTDVTVLIGDVATVEGQEWNTRLVLNGKPGKGYYGPAEVFYDRVNLGTMDVSKVIRTTKPLTPELIVSLINSAYGLWLTADDIDEPIPPVLTEGGSDLVTISSKTTSIGFIGENYFSFEYGRSELSDVVSNRSLTVLKHPIAVTDKLSARMLTWSKDFTSLRDAIKVNKEGTYTDWDAVQVACSVYGIPAWTKGPIVDKATSEVPDSNQLFDRVVIQTGVSSTGMAGSVYLHYNILEEV